MPEQQPRVVLGADPLFQPATGIGNYTRHLARNLLASQLVDDLALYANGVVLQGDTLASLIDTARASPAEQGTRGSSTHAAVFWSAARTYLASKGWAVSAYQTLMPWIDRARLYPYRGAVFHSPNYLLPPFAGPTVATFHDLSIQRYPELHPKARVQLLDKRMAEVAQRASHVITDSALIRREVMDYYQLAPDRVTAIPLAADDRFRPRSSHECTPVLASLGLTYRGFLLFSGTIEPRKNIRRICAAYRDLRDSRRLDVPIIFVGDKGWQSAAEHGDIQDLVARGWAQYLGFVNEQVLATLYSGARALVFPSLYEGFGLPALEAQQSHTPVLTSEGSTMAEFASDHDVLVDPGDTGAIREGMAQLASRGGNDPALASTPKPADRLSWAQTAAQTAAVYRRIQLL